MRLYDISLPLSSRTLTWPGQRPPGIDVQATVRKDNYGLSRYAFSSHAGTHLDAPRHFLARGRGADSIPLEACFGPAVVVAVPPRVRVVGPEHLRHAAIRTGDRVLLKTGNTARRLLHQRRFDSSYAAVGLAAAEWLVKKKVRLIGIDALGIEQRRAPGHPVHVAFLRAKIAILEGADLIGVPPGRYELAAFPVRIVDGDGAPVRAVLIKR